MSLMMLEAGPSGPSGGGFTPADVAGLVLWLDASLGTYQSTGGSAALADGDPVGEWQDQSGSGNDATQATAGARPSLKTGANGLNGLPVLRFDGSADFLDVADAAGLDGGAGLTVFVVAKQDPLAATQALVAKWDYNTDGGWGFQTSPAADDELILYVADSPTDGGSNWAETTDANLAAAWHLLGFVYDAGTVRFCRNGTLLTAFVTGAIPATLQDSAATLKVGKFGGSLDRFYGGDVAAVLVYGAALSNADREAVEAYLTDRYGL